MHETRARFAESSMRFDPNALTGQVPTGAVRYLTHAIRPGTLLARQVEITFSGRVRLKPN